MTAGPYEVATRRRAEPLDSTWGGAYGGSVACLPLYMVVATGDAGGHST